MLEDWRGFQHGGSIPGSVILCGKFRRISRLWDNAHTLNLENCHLYLSSTISQFFWLYPLHSFWFHFYCVTVHTHYMLGSNTVRKVKSAIRFVPSKPRVPSLLQPVRQMTRRKISFHITRGDWDIEGEGGGGLRKCLDTRKGGSEKTFWARRGLRIFVYFKTNTWHHHTDQMVFNSVNNLMTCATQLYHVVYRYNKCSLRKCSNVL